MNRKMLLLCGAEELSIVFYFAKITALTVTPATSSPHNDKLRIKFSLFRVDQLFEKRPTDSCFD